MATMRLHSTGRYVTRFQGKDVYLGRDKVEAEKKFYKLLLLGPEKERKRYMNLKYLMGQYPKKSDRIESVRKIIEENFADYEPCQFGLMELRRFRDMLIPNHCRTEVNRLVRELLAFFKWMVSWEHVDIAHYQTLSTIEPLKMGHSGSFEGKKVSTVPEEAVKTVQAIVNDSVSAMIEMQLLTGARPGEIVNLQVDSLDRSGPVWKISVSDHKSAHLGKTRTLFVGPRGQKVLAPFLLKRKPGEYLFSPKDYLEKRNKEASKPRQYPCLESNKTDRVLNDCYTVASYRRAIARACKKAKVEHWHPHQLRHNAATEIRKQYSVEVARAVLGHSTLSTTEIYAEVDAQVSERVAQEMG